MGRYDDIIGSAGDLIKSLTADNDTLTAERDRLAAENERLREALRPFGADALITIAEYQNRDGIANFGGAACVSYSTTIGALHQARDALQQERPA